MGNMKNRKEIKEKKLVKHKKLKLDIISRIKNRSRKKNILNEISKDIEKIRLKPENLILMEYIDKKISNSEDHINDESYKKKLGEI
jgi:hypothetical protein